MSTQLGAWSGGGLMAVLGWTLLHFLWQGALVALVLWCALELMSGVSARVRYGICCAALALMVVLPVATFLGQGGLKAWQAGQVVSMAPWFTTAVADGSGAGMPLGARVAAALDTAAPVLPWIWLAGVALCAVRLGLGLGMARKLRRSGEASADDAVVATVAALAKRMGLVRAVRLLESARVDAPAVIGWLRPVILLPVCCFTGLSEEQMRALLAHELAHIRRHDYLVSVLQGVVETLLFYHPAVWWVSRQVRRERECCCDEIAAEVAGDRLEYARALAWLEERRFREPAAGLGITGGGLKMRIGRVLGYREGSAASRGTAAAVLVVLLMMCGVVLDRRAHAEKAQAAQVIPAVMTGLSAPAVEHDSAPDEPKAALQRVQRQAGGQDALPDSVSPLYRNWLNQDVVWIITPEERHAFVSLGNDAERDDFIRSFWLRRDGAGGPDSAREEHYARIAYTNQRFGAGEDHPGWKSDRGHAYIAYGRPETVESHPSGGVAPNGKQIAYPFEVWRYASIPGRGQNVQMMFVDPCGCGQYNYTVDGDTRAERRGTLPATPAAKLLPVSSQSSDTTDQPAGARVRVAAGVIAGALVAHPNPVYPAAAKAAGIQGTVVLHALIEKDGTISKVEPISGPAELIDGAVDAVQQWVYRPYLLNGNPVAVDTTIRVNFSLAPLRVPAGALAGNAVSQTAPVYPPDAKANRIQGTVVLKARIGKTGEVSDLQVVNGPEELRQSAIDAVSRWVYKPYLLNGQPTEVETTINVNFTLGQ